MKNGFLIVLIDFAIEALSPSREFLIVQREIEKEGEWLIQLQSLSDSCSREKSFSVYYGN